MKTPLTLFIFLSLSFFTFTQTAQNRAAEILAFKEIIIQTYNPQYFGGLTLTLPMNFGNPTILNPAKVKALKEATIINIDVVYSDFPKDETFQALTQKRIENLIKINPILFSSKDFKWRLLRQANCTDEATAKKLFHGIVITYRPAQTKEMAEQEVLYVKSLLYPTKSNSKLPERDSVVGKVLTRNNWSNMVIVADMTASMSPYTAQLLLWLKLNTNSEMVKQFVFFNDGDRALESNKIIGKTGGIYETRSANFEDVEELAYTVMRNGSGGDIPENNIEALIEATKLCPDCKDIVMIADNLAAIKDIELMSQLKKPVKIILCGAYYGIHTDYLNLARATGGSIHTIEKDLTDLVKLKEGEEVKINRQTYRIINGKFVRISKA